MPRRAYLLVLAATLAGAGLRLWQLTAVPPGLHYDLAATALLGDMVAFQGYRPLFITAYTGHEVLYYYWLAAWFNLVGSSVFTLRLAAALLGILTIPAAFFAVREAFYAEPDSWQLAALAAVLLAFAFFHIVFSRFGFRVISEPLIQSLALGFLFRGLRRLSTPHQPVRRAALGVWFLSFGILDLILAGLFTGLAAYTYLSARLFPFPLAVFWLALLIGLWRVRSSPAVSSASRVSVTQAGSLSPLPLTLKPFSLGLWFLGFGVFALAAALTFAPLGLYFWQHPADFFNRAAQVLPKAGDQTLLWQGVQRAAEMLFLNGEPYDRFNIPGQPLFSFPLGLFFVLGLLITLRNLFRPAAPMRRAAEWLLVAWLPFMLLPTALSVHEIFPSNVRAFGLTPLVFVFPARGLLAAFRWLQRRAPGPLLPTAYPVTVFSFVILAAGAGAAYNAYFNLWANLPAQRMNNDADITGIAQYLNSQTLTDVTPYVTAIHYRHPTAAYLARDFEAIRWLTGGRSLVIPGAGAALILEAASAPLPEDWTAGWEAYREYQQLGRDNVPEFRAFRFAAGAPPPLPDFAPLAENFANAVTLTGVRVLPADDQVTVDLRWHIENPVDTGDFLPYARLYDAAGRFWVQSLDYTYPSGQWTLGDTVLTRVHLKLPAGLPAGTYTIKAGLYSESTGASLPRLDAHGGFGGERAAAGAVTLAGGPAARPAEFQAANAFTPVAASVAGGLQLLGYHLDAPALRPNERFELNLYWRAAQPITTSMEVRLGSTPLTQATVIVRDVLITRLTLRVPLDQPAGPAPLSVVVPGTDPVRLTDLSLSAVERAEQRPPVGAAADAVFAGGLLRLAGYTLTPGPATALRLVWQAGPALIDADYTVFVHVQAADGTLAAQADQMPRAGAYRTSTWVPGEFVTDDYTFNLPAGAYTMSVGLYEAETGRRLPLITPAQSTPLDELPLTPFAVP